MLSNVIVAKTYEFASDVPGLSTSSVVDYFCKYWSQINNVFDKWRKSGRAKW